MSQDFAWSPLHISLSSLIINHINIPGYFQLIFVVDAADRDAMPVAKEELHSLLEKSSLEAIPLLVLANKSDLSEKMSVDEVIEALELKRIVHREISCYGVSAKEETNLEAVLQWLVARSGK